jgi:hypothetical protein
MGSNQMLVGDITYIAKGRLWVTSDVACMSALEAKRSWPHSCSTRSANNRSPKHDVWMPVIRNGPALSLRSSNYCPSIRPISLHTGWPPAWRSGKMSPGEPIHVGLKRVGSAHLGWNDGPALANAIGAGVTPGLSI